MSRRSNVIVILSVFLIVLGLIGSLFFDESFGNRIVNVITASTAVVGAIALFLQFKKDKTLSEATFLMEYSAQFYSTYNCRDLMDELEKARLDPDYVIDTESYYKDIVGYLEWLEAFTALVKMDVISLDKIDNSMSYRYFLIVNNKQIQDCELIVNREFYRGIYSMYIPWVNYKRKLGLTIIGEETALSMTDCFNEMIS